MSQVFKARLTMQLGDEPRRKKRAWSSKTRCLRGPSPLFSPVLGVVGMTVHEKLAHPEIRTNSLLGAESSNGGSIKPLLIIIFLS